MISMTGRGSGLASSRSLVAVGRWEGPSPLVDAGSVPFNCAACGELLRINKNRLQAMSGLFVVIALVIGLFDVTLSLQIAWSTGWPALFVVLYTWFAPVETATAAIPTVPSPTSNRLATGGRALVVAALMAAVIAVANALRMPPPTRAFWNLFVPISAAVCAATGAVGFAAGSDRLNRHFGFLWGARKPNPKETSVVFAIAVAIYAVVLFG